MARNLTTPRDSAHALWPSLRTGDAEEEAIIRNSLVAGIACHHASDLAFVLLDCGIVVALDVHGRAISTHEFGVGNGEDVWTPLFVARLRCPDEEQEFYGKEGATLKWFHCEFLPSTSTLVCASREGVLATLTLTNVSDASGEKFEVGPVEVVGVIDGGLAAMSWRVDLSAVLLISATSDSALMLTNQWDVLTELELPARRHLSNDDNCAVAVSWRGDGESFVVSSRDATDGETRVRIYSASGDLLALGATSAQEGAASALRGIQANAISFAPSGSLIATIQRRVPSAPAVVAFLEKNGLRHGECELSLPPTTTADSVWEVSGVEWDLTSALLLVSWKSVSNEKTIGAVQVYARENYHWYLKQQWTAENLSFLRFDPETIGRLYLSQRHLEPSKDAKASLVRVIDLHWMATSSATRDSTVAMVDGSKLQLTPLGYHTVPPPMSMHTLPLANFCNSLSSACPRDQSFWNRFNPTMEVSPETTTWGLALLLDSVGDLAFLTGESRGEPKLGFKVSLNTILQTIHQGSSLPPAFFRSVTVTEDDDQVIVYLLGGLAVHQELKVPTAKNVDSAVQWCDAKEHANDGMNDVIVAIFASREAFNAGLKSNDGATVFSSVRVLAGLPGNITHMNSIRDGGHSLAIGLQNNFSSAFEILRVGPSDWNWDSNTPLDLVSFVYNPTSSISVVPEKCFSFTVIELPKSTSAAADALNRGNVATLTAQDDPANDSEHEVEYLTIALSVKNRLYCGEQLIDACTSSFSYSNTYRLLLFVTLGSRPHLHFVAGAALLASQRALLAGEGADGAQLDTAIYEAAEPRPVERGARLLSVVSHDSKVIIQLPRGNLELFEPRPMILLRAQRLLLSNRYYDALVLLRRQRVDLNLAIDFDPQRFFAALPSLVKDCLDAAPSTDLLSLLVTALSGNDVMTDKYFLFDEGLGEMRVARRAFITSDNFVGDVKINRVATSIRDTLLAAINSAKNMSSTSMSAVIKSTMQPILCTFAIQKPPLFQDALRHVRSMVSDVTAIAAAIKYLAYLSDGSVLFDSALAACDFEMARLVARHCQMDPRVYLPLLTRFESIVGDAQEGSAAHWLMRYEVFSHLNKARQAIEAYIETLSALSLAESNNEILDNSHVTRMEELMTPATELVDREKLSESILPRLATLEMSPNSLTTSIGPASDLLRKFATIIRTIYARSASTSGNADQAIAALLRTYPPSAVEAVSVAVTADQWNIALAIAQRFYSAPEESFIGKRDALHPATLVASMAASFQQRQEMGMLSSTITAFCTDEDDDDLTSPAILQSLSEIHRNEESSVNGVYSQAQQIAQLVLSHSTDVELAVSILSSAGCWAEAISNCHLYQRDDLLPEVYSTMRSLAKTLIKVLRQRSEIIPGLVASLTTLWADPAKRLADVSSTDTELQKELTAEDEVEGLNDPNADTSSEFSAATKYSSASLRSNASSIRSGTSTVSILSAISDRSNVSLAAPSESQSSSFAIQGLDHSLLSRGTVHESAVNAQNVNSNGKIYKRDRSERRQKRIQRSNAKGSSRGDAWGLRQENAICARLCSMLHLQSLTRAITQLTSALQLTGESSDVVLALAIPQAMQNYVVTLQNHSPPLAPAYPSQWLVTRKMSSVKYFQDPRAAYEGRLLRRIEVSHGENLLVMTDKELDDIRDSLSWWHVAASGIAYWFDNKPRSLILASDDARS